MKNKFKKHSKIRHLKTGGVYLVLDVPSELVRLEYCNEGFYRYMLDNIDDSTIWIRRSSEMEDGRFEEISNGTN